MDKFEENEITDKEIEDAFEGLQKQIVENAMGWRKMIVKHTIKTALVSASAGLIVGGSIVFGLMYGKDKNDQNETEED